MLDDEDEGVSGRLWAMLAEKFGLFAPVFIARRPEALTILDYRPTLWMCLAGAACLALSGVSVYVLVIYAWEGWELSLAAAALAAVCFALLFRGTIREVYQFDKTTETYVFTRQFIHRQELIEGSIGQFTGAYVKTVSGDESESYFVVLNQEGMFLTGVTDQTLRENVSLFNSYSTEARIANAISGFLQR
jgi:hypothetical protein